MADTPDSCIACQRAESDILNLKADVTNLSVRTDRIGQKLDVEHDEIVKIRAWQEYQTKSMDQLVISVDKLSKKMDLLHDDVTKAKGGVSIANWFSERWMSIVALIAAVVAWAQMHIPK